MILAPHALPTLLELRRSVRRVVLGNVDLIRLVLVADHNGPLPHRRLGGGARTLRDLQGNPKALLAASMGPS